MSEVARLAIGLTLPAAAAWAALARVGVIGSRASERIAWGVFSLMLGVGASSIWTFAWILAGGHLGVAFVAADAALWAVAAGVFLLAVRGSRSRGSGEAASQRAARRDIVKVAAVTILALGLVFTALHLARLADWIPHGDMDAWNIWNHRARCAFRWSGGPPGAFDGCTSAHPEYPLLLPLSVARLWAWAGETTLAPIALAFAFTLAGAAVVASAASRVAGAVAGAAAGLLVLGTPSYAYWGAVQMADVPVAALLAAAMSALLLAGGSHGGRRNALVAIAGALLGLAAWTKNDGLAAAAVAFLVRIAFESRARGAGAAAREAAWIGSGAGLPAAAWLVFHFGFLPQIAPELGQSAGDAFARLADPDRWHRVVVALAEAFPGRAVGLPVAVVAVALLLGARPRALLRSEAVWTALAMYVVFAIVFVVTPQPLEWHLDTAGLRLVLQPWPTAILGLLAASAAPQVEAVVSPAASTQPAA